MALLSLYNVSLAFNGIPLLDKAALQVEKGERICLLGRNGAGKTTLLKLINCEIQPDDGEISFQQNIKKACLYQELPANVPGTVFDRVVSSLGKSGDLLREFHQISHELEKAKNPALITQLSRIQHEIEINGAWDNGLKAEKIISFMNLNKEAEFNSLSVGMKRRVHLAAALIHDPDLLILDEPTNHLDLEAIEWLETFLQTYPGTLIFVTHDRVFLKKLATRILLLDRGKLLNYACDYEKFLQRREDELTVEETQNAVFDKKLSQEETWIRRGVKARTRRNQGRVKALMRLRQIRADRRLQTGNVRLGVQDFEKSGKLVIDLKNISFSYIPDQPVISNFSASIMRGDKIGIIGPNGCGKSTLIRLMMGELIPKSGDIKQGTNLGITYFDQSREQIDDNLTLQENIAGKNDTVIFNGRPKHIIAYLQDFLFTKDQINSFAGTLSGGEKNRLLLAKMFTQSANLLILDEPTNDLDIETLELLEEILIEYEGTVLLVSHDREFLNNIACDVIVFEGEGKLTRYIGGYDDWKIETQSNIKTITEKPKKEKTDEKPQNLPDKPKKISFKEKKELEEIPVKIEKLETEQGELIRKTEDAQFYKNNPQEIKTVRNRLSQLEDEIHTLYERWNELENIANH